MHLLPKFHCKLNDIEYHWGAVKRCAGENCNYSSVELEDTGFDSDGWRTVRRLANRARRWVMDISED